MRLFDERFLVQHSEPGGLLLLLFPHISPISRTRGHRRTLPFQYHRYIQKTQTKEEKEREKITDEKTSPDLVGGEGKK